MDTKNDDSGGSDSLDKSLQKKCVMDDVGQVESGAGGENLTTTTTQRTDGQRPGNSKKKQKTEKHVGDGSSSVGGSTSTTSSSSSVLSDSSSSTSKQISNKQDDKIPATLHNMVATSSSTASSSSSISSNTKILEVDATPTTSNVNKTDAANCSNNSNAFETKVKQISKDLKETTLAETSTAATTETITANKQLQQEQITSDESTTASTSSTTSSVTSPDGSEISNVAVNADDQAIDIDDTPMNTSMISDSNDDADSRSKKVRFHPDVKENDGGNRVIPKKKKKLKANSGDDASTSSQTDEMELDEDDDYEEDEFDLAKTIAEAQDYLKEHPLTFVRPCDKSAGRLQNGLLEEDDLKHLETAEEEEFIDAVIPENGIERILGKQTKGGRVEFLLRFTNQPGLFWESEDFIATQCPSLLTQYEFNRERRQERLMRHVAKRQNLRQRYTDF